MAKSTCEKCGKPLRGDNRSGFCYRCRSYSQLTPYGKQANCDRSKKNSAAFRVKIDVIKLERGCVDCGYNRYPEALDFDHLPGVKKTKSVAFMWGYSWEKVLAEIAKCEIVCSNCHRHRTKIRSDAAKAERDRARAEMPRAAPRILGPAVCGTESGYQRHLRNGEAACAECKVAKVAIDLRRRLERRTRGMVPLPGLEPG